MALFAFQLRSGELSGSYTDARAELFARSALIPDEEFVEVVSGHEGRGLPGRAGPSFSLLLT